MEFNKNFNKEPFEYRRGYIEGLHYGVEISNKKKTWIYISGMIIGAILSYLASYFFNLFNFLK